MHLGEVGSALDGNGSYGLTGFDGAKDADNKRAQKQGNQKSRKKGGTGAESNKAEEWNTKKAEFLEILQQRIEHERGA
jgi:hypothetical protein